MKFDEKDLSLAVDKKIISADTFDVLINFLNGINAEKKLKDDAIDKENRKKFTFENFLYYFGALIIISTMGWYLGNIWESFGHGGLLAVCIVYFLIFTLLGNLLWKKDKKIPGGLLYTCAVSVVPLGVWAFESLVGIMPNDLSRYSDFHKWIRSGWILMEIATILAGLIFLKFRKFPFLTLPVCYALWYLSMDIVPVFAQGALIEPSWGMRNFATFFFAIFMLGIALKFDRKTKDDFSGWFYIFGSTLLWCVIPSIFLQFKIDNEFAYFVIAAFSFFYMIISIILQRKIFIVWGAIGVFAYIGHLAYVIFKDSPIFPLMLVLFGLFIIFSGLYYSKNCRKIEEKIRKLLIK